jgi:hypothetical protein
MEEQKIIQAAKVLGDDVKVNYWAKGNRYYIDGFHYSKKIWVKKENDKYIGGANRNGAFTELNKVLDILNK